MLARLENCTLRRVLQLVLETIPVDHELISVSQDTYKISLAEGHYKRVVVTFDWNTRPCGKEILNLISAGRLYRKKKKNNLRYR